MMCIFCVAEHAASSPRGAEDAKFLAQTVQDVFQLESGVVLAGISSDISADGLDIAHSRAELVKNLASGNELVLFASDDHDATQLAVKSAQVIVETRVDADIVRGYEKSIQDGALWFVVGDHMKTPSPMARLVSWQQLYALSQSPDERVN